jgi:hypothetical protein
MELGVFESPGQEWDEFAERYTDLLFYRSLWSGVLKKGLGGDPLYFYLKEGGQIVAGLPGVALGFGFLRILYASIPYGNLIGEKSYFQLFMELLEQEFRRRRLTQVRIVESPISQGYQPASFKSVSSKCTLLDLRKFDQERVPESYRSEVRRAIRKAQKSGVSLRKAGSEKEVEAFYRLYHSSMERKGAPTKYPPRWFISIYEILCKEGKADFLLASKDDQLIAGVALIRSCSSDHYLHNGSDDAHLDSRPNDFIVDHIIQGGVKEGKHFLDFMGSDPADLSLIRFKEKWGSRSLDIHTYVKDISPLKSKIWELGRKTTGSKWGAKALRWIR